MPDKDIERLLGIGVADNESTCALGAISLNFSFVKCLIFVLHHKLLILIF